MSPTMLPLLLTMFGLATVSQHATAQSAAPGLIFPFYSVINFSVNATSYETETLIATPNATNSLYIYHDTEMENATSSLGPILIQAQGVGSSNTFILANLTASSGVYNINGSAADSFTFTVTGLNVNPSAYVWYGQIVNGTGKYANAVGVAFGQTSLVPQNVTNPAQFVLAGPTVINGIVAVPTNATNLAAVLGGTSSSSSASTAAPAATLDKSADQELPAVACRPEHKQMDGAPDVLINDQCV